MYSIVNVCSVNCVYSDHTVRKGEERLNGEEKAEGERIQKGEERQRGEDKEGYRRDNAWGAGLEFVEDKGETEVVETKNAGLRN